jgi:tetratricopeptide (TPR) repeat protein
MTACRNAILLLFAITCANCLFGQATKGLEIEKPAEQQAAGKTYALIVGISKYQYPECYPTLNYADVDARTFYKYMISKTGGNVDPANIDTLFNAGATQQDFWKKFNSIKNRLQKNDNFYIYFSGHGDAISSDMAFLLTYNAPPGNDRNNYYTTGGVVDIHVLKSLVKMITLDKNKPANVILITDACRSNELPPGKEEGRQQFYDEMYTKNAGEVQLVSCMANQVSFEDAKWGGGRGLFSWHLVNGLMGMADNKPEDGEVTLKELFNYVSDKVQEDSYDPANKKYRQTPDYCCRDKDAVVLAKVDKAAKEQLAEMLKRGSVISSTTPVYASKGVNLGEELANEGLSEMYKQFRAAIDENRLIEPASNNAMNLLQQMLAKDIKPELKSDLKFELSSRLMNDVTKVMNEYLFAATNNNNYTFDYFNNAAKKLRAFLTISDTLYYSKTDIKVNLLFLEGHSKWHSTKTYELRESLRKVDSAIALKPQASFLYNLKGLMHMMLGQYKEAETTLRRGIQLAPNWLYPYHNLGMTLASMGKYDSSLVYLFNALKLDSNYQTTFGGIAAIYHIMGKSDSAIYYAKKGLEKDPTDPHIWTDLGNYYSLQRDWKNALRCYYQGMHYDSTNFKSYMGALKVHLNHYTSRDSVQYYRDKMIHSSPENPVMYNELAGIYTENDLDTLAMETYERSLTLDSTNANTWVLISRLFNKLKHNDLAVNCLQMALTIDPRGNNDFIYNELGILYYRMNVLDKSLEAIASAIIANPANATYYSNYAYIAMENKDVANAVKYYREAIRINPEYSFACFELAKILAGQAKNAEALKQLANAIKYGNYKRSDIEDETAFVSLKENKEFKALLLKLKE